MVLGPGGRDHDSQNQLFLMWEAPRYFKKSKKIKNNFQKIVFLENVIISSKLESSKICVPIIVDFGIFYLEIL